MKRITKLMVLVLALAFAIAVGTTSANAEIIDSGPCGKNGDNLTWTYDGSTKALTISGTGEMQDGWMGIYDAPWYPYCTDITTVVINDGVTSIGANAFANCPNINSVTIADSVTEIMHHAFLHADSLQSIELPANLTTIGYSAFYGCDILDNVTIPDSVITMENRVFANCESLTNVVIGKNVESIEYQTFFHTNIQSIDIPEGVKAIYTEAFARTKIKEITIPKSVTELGGVIFDHCDDLTTILYEGTQEEWTALTDGVSLGISLEGVDLACADDPLAIILQGPVRVNDIYPSMEGKWSVGDTGTAKANKPVTWSVSTTGGDKVSIDSSTGKFKIEYAEKMPAGQYRNAFIRATATDGSGETERVAVTVTLLCRSFNVCFKDGADHEIAAAGTVCETDTEYYLPTQAQLTEDTVPSGKRLKAWKLTENGKSLEFNPGTSFTYAQYPPQRDAQTRTFTPVWENLQPFDCDIRELDFGTKKEGYGRVSSKKVTIYNNLDEVIVANSRSTEGYSVAWGQSRFIQPHTEKTITVQPIENLPAEKYDGELTLSYYIEGNYPNTIDGPSIDLKFTVTHDLTVTEAVAPTCFEGGNDKYYTCSYCGKYFSDEQGQTEIGKDSWILPPAGHDWKYTGEGNTITAKCQRKTCDHEASVKLIATGKVYDGKPAEATAQKSENWDSEAGIMSVGHVMYKYDGKNNYNNDVPPTNAGSHSARVHLQNSDGVFRESVVQDFAITKQPIEFTAENKNCSDLDKGYSLTYVMDDEKNWHEGDAPDLALKVTDSSGNVIDPKTAPAGKYAITPSWAEGKENPNYDAAFIAGEFKTAHDICKKDRVEPTDTEDGAKEHYECSVCGKFFSDEQGTTVIPASEVIIPKGGSGPKVTPASLDRNANPLQVKGNTVKVKYKKLKKKSQTIKGAKAITVSNPQGQVTYQKVSVTYTKAKSVKLSKKALKKYTRTAAKKITINAGTGNVTVKKGLKKGTYRVNVNVMAAGNAEYDPSPWKTVTLKIKVR